MLFRSKIEEDEAVFVCDSITSDEEEEAVFIHYSITNEDPPNAHQAQHRPKPRVR